jgi:hypothetical protein
LIWLATGNPVPGFPGQFLPMNQERFIQCFIALISGLCGRQNNYIQRYICSRPKHSGAEIFPDHAPDTIAANGFCTGFLGYSHTKTVLLYSIRPCQNPETVIRCPDRLLKYHFELCWLKQSRLPGKLHHSWPVVVLCLDLLAR